MWPKFQPFRTNPLKQILAKLREPESADNTILTADLDHPFSCLPLSRNDVSLVIDVGAFHGSVTWAAAKSYPAAKIIAFEPTNDSAATFRSHTAPISDRIEFYQIGLSDCQREGVINLTTTGGANSVHAQSEEHQRENPHVRECGKQTILLNTLDNILGQRNEAIDILKIDVEGHELNVLRGASATLKRVKFVILEVALSRDEDMANQNAVALFNYMQRSDFYLYSIIDVYRFDKPEPHLGMAQFDAIFRQNKIPRRMPNVVATSP